jgi:hypothetical protein
VFLSICVQHHPSRELPVPLAGYEVVSDPEPDGPASALRTYIECLRTTPPECSHRLVLQDDVELCRDFDSRAHHALRERGDTLVAFFVPGMALHGRWMREAHARGERWLELPPRANWQPTVALAWPRELAADFVPFAEEHVATRARHRMGTVGDDPVVGRYVRARRLTVMATVPCLVEHPDTQPSLVKQRSYNGTNPARKAAIFTAEQ